MEKELIRPATAAERYDMSRKAFDRQMRTPGSPRPIRLSRRMVLFKRAELDEFFSSKQSVGTPAVEVAHV